MMPICCLYSFVAKGLREGFALGYEGDEHTCETCGRVYVMHGTWELKDSGL